MSARPSLVPLVVCLGAVAAGWVGSAGAASGEITAPQVRAYAEAVNLREGDLPGATIGPRTGEISIDEDERFFRCAGMGQLSEPVARVQSETLELDHRGIAETDFYSAVEALPTELETAELLEAFQRGRGFRCLRRILTRHLNGMRSEEGVELKNAVVSRRQVPLPSPAESLGFRIRYVAVSERFRLPVYIDILSFLPGAIEIELLATSYPKPPRPAQERRLLEILHERALAAQL